LTRKQGRRRLGERHPAIHRRPAQPRERFRLGHVEPLLQCGLGSFYVLARLCSLTQGVNLASEILYLSPPGHGKGDAGLEIGHREGLDHIADGTGLGRLGGDIPLAERSDHDYGA